MTSRDQVVEWARALAAELQSGMQFVSGTSDGYGGYWKSDDARDKGAHMARAASGLEFLRQYAGGDSEWLRRAKNAYESNGDRASMETGVHAVGEILNVWSEQVASGVVRLPADQGERLRLVASTDVMEQVRTLNEDRSIHPAAPIVLAGAALETALRAAVEQLELDIGERPGIGAYGRALRAAGVISKQDAKDIDQMAGLRNSAAHGDFDQLSRERAGLMEQQVNLFLSTLSSTLDDSTRDSEAGQP